MRRHNAYRVAGVYAGFLYVLKDAAKKEVLQAIRTVMEDQVYLSPGIAGTVVDAAKSKSAANVAPALALLTERERECVHGCVD